MESVRCLFGGAVLDGSSASASLRLVDRELDESAAVVVFAVMSPPLELAMLGGATGFTNQLQGSEGRYLYRREEVGRGQEVGFGNRVMLVRWLPLSVGMELTICLSQVGC